MTIDHPRGQQTMNDETASTTPAIPLATATPVIPLATALNLADAALESGTNLRDALALLAAAVRAGPGGLSLTPEEAVVAWRALDMMDSASFSPEDDLIIARVTAHFARQLSPRPGGTT